MAEGGNLSRTVLGGSGEIYDYNCSPCEKAGVYKEAHKYCNSCKLFYCKKCVSEHNIFPALRGHQIIDSKSQPKHAGPKKTLHTSVPAAPLEACEHHPEEMIKMYCGEHDIVSCAVCIALDHRECKDINYILNLAKDIRRSQDYTNYVEELKRMKTEYEEIKQSIQDEIKAIGRENTDIIKEINEYKIDLVSRIEELERMSIEKVNERYEQIKDTMNATASDVDGLLVKLTSLVQEIDIASEAQLFVSMKRMSIMAEEERMINRSLHNFEGLSFSLDEKIRNALYNVDELATPNFPFKIILREEYDITSDDDEPDKYSVRDMSMLEDNTVVVVYEDMLKRFSTSFDKLDSKHVPGQLVSVCKTSHFKELAVSIRDKQTIQFIEYTAKEMCLTESFSVGVSCKGICCRNDYLFVACGGGDYDNVQGHVRQYDLTGDPICIFDIDDRGQQIFTSPRLMTYDSNTNNIYVTDRDNGIIVLDEKGKLTGHLYNSFLKNGYGICHTTGNNIFVTGNCPDNIQQYDEAFRYIGTSLISGDRGSLNPTGILLVSVESKTQIIVSFENHNKVYVYDIDC